MQIFCPPKAGLDFENDIHFQNRPSGKSFTQAQVMRGAKDLQMAVKGSGKSFTKILQMRVTPAGKGFTQKSHSCLSRRYI